LSTTPITTSPPPETAQTTATTANPAAGPFSSFLDPSQVAPSTYQASQQRPSGYMGKLGKGAMIIDKFLEGMSKGRAMQYAKSRQKEADIYNRIGQTEEYVRKSDIDPALQKQQIDKLEALRLGILRDQTSPDAAGGGGDSGQGGKKKGKKDDQDQSPIVKFFHQAATNMLGPGAQASSFDEKTVRATLGDVSHDVRMAQSQTAQIAQFGSIAINKISKGLSDGTIKSRADIFKDPELAQIMNALGKTPTDKLPSGLVEIIKSIPEKAETAKVTDYGTAEVDGKQINVVRTDKGLEDGKGNPVSLDTIKPGSLRMGNESAPKPPTEKQVELDRAYASWSKTLVKDKLDDGEKSIVAKLERNPDNPLSISVQAILNKQPKGAKNLQGAYDAAINLSDRERQTKIAESASNASLNAALKKLTLDDKKDKYNPRELDDVSRSIVNDVHGDGTPASEAEIARLRKSASDPKDPKRTESADALRKWAVGNVRDHPEFYQHLTDQQREQVIHHIDGMPVDKMVGRGGSAAAATTFNDPSKAKADASKSNGAAGAMRRTDAVPETKAEKTASNVPPGAIIPKATKPVTTESQLRADAKAKGMQTAAIDAMVKHYKDLGYVR